MEYNKKTISAIVILITIFYFALLRPAITGYGVYQEMQKQETPLEVYSESLNDLNEKLSEANAKAETYKEVLEQQSVNSENYSQEISQCQIKLSECNNNFQNYQESTNKEIEQLATINSEKIAQERSIITNDKVYMDQMLKLEREKMEIQINITNQKLQEKIKEFNKLASNNAREICCRKKFDNPSINSYSVGNGFILCSSEGEMALQC
tara:strand:+ start:701 stop:1327 length:627 start_codon:yes stop_codon:yes gene_type:complete